MLVGIVVLLSLALSYVLFGSLFFHLIETWRIDPFYLHGPWVALAALFLYLRFLYTRGRQKVIPAKAGIFMEGDLLPLEFRDVLSAVLLFSFSAAVFVFGIQTRVPFLGGLAFTLWCITLHLLLFGVSGWRGYSFPFLYFLFSVPLPYLGELSGMLQIFIASLSKHIFLGLGYPIQQSGITLSFPNAAFQIAADCTGIKSWLVLFSLVVFFLTFIRLRFSLKMLIAILILPVAFFSNMTRIVTLLFLGFYKGEKIAMAFWHDFSGITFYGVSCLLMLLIVFVAIRHDRPA